VLAGFQQRAQLVGLRGNCDDRLGRLDDLGLFLGERLQAFDLALLVFDAFPTRSLKLGQLALELRVLVLGAFCCR